MSKFLIKGEKPKKGLIKINKGEKVSKFMECHIHIEEYGRSISSLLIASMDTTSKYSPFSTDPQILQLLCTLHVYLQILAKFVDLITRLHISLQSYDKYGYLHNYYLFKFNNCYAMLVVACTTHVFEVK